MKGNRKAFGLFRFNAGDLPSRPSFLVVTQFSQLGLSRVIGGDWGQVRFALLITYLDDWYGEAILRAFASFLESWNHSRERR